MLDNKFVFFGYSPPPPREALGPQTGVTKDGRRIFEQFLERFKTRFKMRIEKSLEKIRKSRIWGTKNPSKINPKLNQNRCSQKHTIFQRFAMTFSCELQRPNLKFCAPTQCFVSFSHRSRACLLHTFWVQKAYQKPFQNEVWTL